MKKILTLSVVILLIALTCVLPMFAADNYVEAYINGEDDLVAGSSTELTICQKNHSDSEIGSVHIKLYDTDYYTVVSGYFVSDIENAFMADFDLTYNDGVIVADTGDALALPKKFFKFTIEIADDAAIYGQEIDVSYYVEFYDVDNNLIEAECEEFAIYVRCPESAHTWDEGHICGWNASYCRYYICETCGEQKYIEDHVVEVIPGKAATCTENGYTAGAKCSFCGELITPRYIIKGGHKFGEWTLYSEATCEKNAVEYCSCSVCFVNFAREVEGTALGHDWSDYKFNAAGHYKVCTVCGEKSDVVAHVSSGAATETEAEVCTVCGYVITPAIGHIHSMVYTEAKDATCTEAGNVAYYTCSGCNKKFSDAEGTQEISDVVIAAKGHTRVVDAAVAATCTTDGKTEGAHCSVCQAILQAQTTVKATGHSFGDWIVMKEATATEDGKKIRQCAYCDAYEMETIPATGEQTTDAQTTEPAEATTAPETEPSEEEGGANVGAIVGCSVGGVVVLGAAGWFFFFFKKKKKSKQ